MGWSYWYRDHGIKKGLAIEHYPDRVKPALCSINGNNYTVLGYMRNKSAEDLFFEQLDGLLAAERRETLKEIKPVTHAHWTYDIDDLSPMDSMMICSNCGGYEHIYANGNYCGNCGAKMDEEVQ